MSALQPSQLSRAGLPFLVSSLAVSQAHGILCRIFIITIAFSKSLTTTIPELIYVTTNMTNTCREYNKTMKEAWHIAIRIGFAYNPCKVAIWIEITV
jgi:hypothetical protein